jgi:hypothetical protein
MLKPLICFKKICKFHSVEGLDIDPFFCLIHFSSIILIHPRPRIEPNVANLIIKSFPKVEKIPKLAIDFHEFWSIKLHCEK